ncbi:MAG TPA: hypothetical protein VFI73_09745 [Candidatus Nitrosopolaris sp.]|nr:hypothetical protein [Candidatus Nitrosopolaris sp.]
MTIIIAAMQDSLLSIESGKSGWKTHESLRGTHPQWLAFEPRNATVRIVGRLAMYCGRLMMLDRLGIE